MNPVPYGDTLSLCVNENDNRISFDLAIDTAKQFGINKSDARALAREISSIVKANWERLAKQYGLSQNNIEAMRPAFSEIC